MSVKHTVRLTRKPSEVGPLLGISRNNVYELIRTGELRCIRVGRNILVPVTAIDDFLRGKRSV